MKVKVIIVLFFEWIILLSIAWWVAYTIHLVSEINDKVSYIYNEASR